ECLMWKSPPAKKFPTSRAQLRMPLVGRRHFLAGAGASLFVPGSAFADVSGARQLFFDNLHTGEKLKVEYWAQGRYLPDALAQVNHVLRDFRSGDVYPIAPRLLDLLSVL